MKRALHEAVEPFYDVISSKHWRIGEAGITKVNFQSSSCSLWKPFVRRCSNSLIIVYSEGNLCRQSWQQCVASQAGWKLPWKCSSMLYNKSSVGRGCFHPPFNRVFPALLFNRENRRREEFIGWLIIENKRKLRYKLGANLWFWSNLRFVAF